MKRLSLIAAVALAVTTVAVAAAPQSQKVSRARALELYNGTCAACHGPDGKSPVPGMSFVDREWKHGRSLPAVVKTITNGVPGTAMMPFKGRFTPAEIQALARLVRSFDKKVSKR